MEANLPLARSLVARSPARLQISFDDLLQVASLALIRAVEAFDPTRGISFSSFAVPTIRGALLHELRDRRPMVRIPRSLWDLRQRVRQLQDARRTLGQTPLDRVALTLLLGCSEADLIEVERLQEATEPRSLDAPRAADPEAGTLLEGIADPRSLSEGGGSGLAAAAVGGSDGEGEPAGVWNPDEQAWLRERLQQLDPQRRQLIEGRYVLGMTWVELGRQLRIHPRMAQRRCLACLSELKQQAALWSGAHGLPIGREGEPASARIEKGSQGAT